MGGSALIQLMAYSAQDAYLVNNPPIFPFKTGYNRHTDVDPTVIHCEQLSDTNPVDCNNFSNPDYDPDISFVDCDNFSNTDYNLDNDLGNNLDNLDNDLDNLDNDLDNDLSSINLEDCPNDNLDNRSDVESDSIFIGLKSCTLI